LSGVIFINRNGLRWRDTPVADGPHKTLYKRWKRWKQYGHFCAYYDRVCCGSTRQ
jgi:transposase